MPDYIPGFANHISTEAIPEPSALALVVLAAGLAAPLYLSRLRRRRAAKAS